jgi:hypothetical protein
MSRTLFAAAVFAMLGCGAGVIEGPPGSEGAIETTSIDRVSPAGLAAPRSSAAASATVTASASNGGAPEPPPAEPPAAEPPAAEPPAAEPSPAEPPPAEPPPPAARYVRHDVTFYGWADNTPAGAAIAFPTIHAKAGGTGTYDDPLTFATDRDEWPPGTRLYVPFIQKYVVMEDSCTKCSSDWDAGIAHIDIWMTSEASYSTALLACEKAWTRDDLEIEIDPPKGRPVGTAPLFDVTTGTCRTP